MTATVVRDQPATLEPGPADLAAAAELLGRSGIRLRPTVYPEAAAWALARALVACEPGSPHRLLLLAGVRRRTRGEKRRDGARPIQERAIRVLLGIGQTPTAGAVAGWVRNHEQRQAARMARAQRLAPLVIRDGPAAAAFVLNCWRQRGVGPTRGDLRRRMRWRPVDLAASLEVLEGDGWLVYDPAARVLRPGPRAEAAG